MHHVIQTIAVNGYWGVFLLVFLQEIGIPNPIFNETVLAFAGSMGYAKVLSLPLVVLSAVSADIIGTTILYLFFYFFTRWVLFLRFIPVSFKEKINRLPLKMKRMGPRAVFWGRMIPFLRGYFSVGAGIVRMNPAAFLLQVACSAVIWSGGYVIIGGFLLHRYAMKGQNIEAATEHAMYWLLFIVALTYWTMHIWKAFIRMPKRP